MTIIKENVTSGDTATMTCVRWPISAPFGGVLAAQQHAAAYLTQAGSCASVAILTQKPSIDAKSAVAHATGVVRGMDVSDMAKDGDAVVAIDPDATDKFDTRLGLKTWSPPPV